MVNAQQSKDRLAKAKRKKVIRSRLLYGGIGIAVFLIIGFVLWTTLQPPVGEGYPIMGVDHVPDNEFPGEYNSDPPTSGPHYAVGLPRGFYDISDLPQLPPYPEGHLVHNLEHGYIIFWYNCDVITEDDCTDLKTQMIDYMENTSNIKLIAFPWASIDHPLVLTSWGYLLELHSFDEDVVRQFINRNKSLAPEPNAP
jgi:hypothetical protein